MNTRINGQCIYLYVFILFISVTYNAFIIGNHRISLLLIHEFRDESNPSH